MHARQKGLIESARVLVGESNHQMPGDSAGEGNHGAEIRQRGLVGDEKGPTFDLEAADVA